MVSSRALNSWPCTKKQFLFVREVIPKIKDFCMQWSKHSSLDSRNDSDKPEMIHISCSLFNRRDKRRLWQPRSLGLSSSHKREWSLLWEVERPWEQSWDCGLVIRILKRESEFSGVWGRSFQGVRWKVAIGPRGTGTRRTKWRLPDTKERLEILDLAYFDRYFNL